MAKMIRIESCINCEMKHRTPFGDASGNWYCNFIHTYVTDQVHDRTIHPDCQLPDHVDVSKLQKERYELAKLLSKAKDMVCCEFCDIDNHSANCIIITEALAKIKGEI